MTISELRDHFAGLAMQSLIADNSEDFAVMHDALDEEFTEKPPGTPATPHLEVMRKWLEVFPRYTAFRAYQQADAMMREREKS